MAAALCLSGCWDRREVNDIAIVSGNAFDKVGNKYRAAVQFPLAGQLGGAGGGGGGTSGGKSWYVDSGSGLTIKEANVKLQRSLSRQLYFSHRRVLIIGEAAAREGISPLLDITVRTAQNRMSALIVFAKGEGLEVLETDAQLEQQPSEIVREITVNAMKKPRTIKHTVQALLTEGKDLAAPYFASDQTVVSDDGEKKPRITMEGLAVFKEDKLVGFVSGEPSKGILWAMNQARRPVMTVKPPAGEGYLTVLFSENNTKLVPVVNGDDISMLVKIRASGNIVENQSNYEAGADNMEELSKLVSEQLKSDVGKSVKLIQQYNSDVCGFGDTIYRERPKVWKKIKQEWYSIYPTMKVNVEVELQMEHANTTLDPVAKNKELLVE
jgi:spore germination protein KC